MGVLMINPTKFQREFQNYLFNLTLGGKVDILDDKPMKCDCGECDECLDEVMKNEPDPNEEANKLWNER